MNDDANKDFEVLPRAMFEQSAVGVAVVETTTGRFLRVNRRLCDILGATTAELLGIGFADITHPDDVTTDLENLRRMVSGEIRGFTREKRYRHKNGAYVWVNLTVSPLSELGQLPGHNLAIIEDISTRKRAEASLDSWRRFLDRIVNTSPSLVYIYDLMTGRNVYANRNTLEFLGYDRARIEAEAAAVLEHIIHPDDLPTVAEHHARLATASDADVFEIDYRLKDALGKWRWIHGRDAAFERTADGRVAQIVGLAEDVTDRMTADGHRRERERFLEESQEAARAGWYSLDVRTGMWQSSSLLDRIFGISADFARDVSGWLRIVHPDDQADMLDHFQRHVLQLRNPFDRQYRIVRIDDGETRWVHGRGGLTFDAAGNPVNMAGLIQDITDQKQAERERERLQAQLA